MILDSLSDKAMVAKRELFLANLTPEKIALNTLLDVSPLLLKLYS